MASWAAFQSEQPEFAARVKTLLDGRTHKTMATLRRDGGPRISGTELDIVLGEAWFGSMPGARKGQDLRRDPRVAVHGGTEDPPAWTGDAKLLGLAVESTEEQAHAAFVRARSEAGGETPPGVFDLFRIDLKEVVITRLGDPPDHLVIESWKEGHGLRMMERR